MGNKAKTPKRGMSDDHKAALALGRSEGLIVRRYLEGLEAMKKGRGRARTSATIQKRLASVESALASASALSRLHLLQERKNLKTELASLNAPSNLDELEKRFVKVAKGYGDRKGITYGTWRSVGVSATTLQKAKITRSGN